MKNETSNLDSTGKKIGKGIAKFFVALLMFIILIGITLFVVGVAIAEFINSDMDTPVALTLGIILSVIYAIVVFAVPYLRKMKNSCRWFAILALGDAAWWAYLLITGM